MEWPLMLRPLPRPVAPFRDETITSYLHRLAGPNHIHPARLRSWLTRSDRTDAPVPLARLAAVTGIPCQSLACAMPQICTAAELSDLPARDRPRARPGWAFPACRACAAGQPVTRWALHDDVVCYRHRRWISKDHGQPDLDIRGALAYWTGKAGDAAGARAQFAELLPIEERVLGPEHPLTLATRSNLAGYTGQAGDAAGARDQLAALLPIQERVLGAGHWDILDTRANLALYTGEAGDAAGARDQLAALLPIQERVLGPEHPLTLATRSNLTYWAEKADRGRN
jgi:hypothetical protein